MVGCGDRERSKCGGSGVALAIMGVPASFVGEES